MIKNIIFDIGDVLLNFEPYEYLSKRVSDSKLTEELYKIIFQSDEWQQLDRGLITEEEALERFCMRHREKEKIIRDVMDGWYEMLTPIDECVGILPKLKEKGYNMYLLSNYHRNSFKYVYNKYNFFKLFDGKVISYKVRYLKPEYEIYDMLTQKYDLAPEQCLFIDDTKQNTEAAKQLGFATIHFTSPENLIKDLKTLDVL